MTSRNFWFGCIFIAAGSTQICMVAFAVWNWSSVRAWQPTEAIVVGVELETTTSGGPRQRSSSTTLSVKYKYTWEGDVIHAQGVSPFLFIEPFSSQKREIAEQLRTAKSRGQTVTCYVNPNNPEMAYLRRDFRPWSVVFVSLVGLVFFGAGVVMMRQHWKRNARLTSNQKTTPASE